MSELAVEATGLTKRYGATTALAGIGIRVERASVYALAGPRGGGKTTVLRILASLTRPASGEVMVLGRMAPDQKLRARVGYMPHEVGLYGDLTIHENLALFGELLGVGAAEMEVREAELLEVLGVREPRSIPVSRLGESARRKVSLAVALVHQPELLVLDEPTCNGDPELKAAFWALATRLGSHGVTVIHATSDLGDAARSDRVGLLRQGVMLAEGSADEIRRKAGATTLEEAYVVLSRKGNQA